MQLSQEQQKAAFTESPKALVLAGAGSGKTRVLTARIKHLIEEKQVSPYEIISFTFTRKGSGEMIERLGKEIGHTAAIIKSGTIHGVSLKLLQTYGELVGLRPDKITVYGSWEEQFLLKDVAKELGYYTGHAWKKVKKGDVEAAFNLYYTTGAMNPESERENALMNAFFGRCRENNALTYGSILTTFLRLIRHIWQYLNLRHVLVDETQDNDPLQWEIINQLCAYTGASLFAVGDIRQSIFSFRGADPEYLIRNQGQFDVYTLQDNYRSSANIVEAANKLIAHNALNMGESMRAMRKELIAPIMHLNDMDSTELCDFLRATQSAPANKNTAILARNHWPLKKLSRLLDEAGIKHEYIGKKSGLVRSEEFRRFHAFLKLIVNPFDNFSFLLIKDYLGVSNAEYREIRVMAVQNSKSHFQEWKTLRYDGDLKLDWLSCADGVDINTVIDAMKSIEWKFDPGEILSFVYAWILENPAGTIAQYLGWLATFDVQDELKEDSDCLQLLTMHSSKGLEFSTVIAIGLNEGIFPDKRDIDANALEDSRRLAYVCFTRAENQLILTSRPEKDKYDKKYPVSRFISEALN